MRLVLLAILSLVLIAPTAEASRRDDDRGRQTSQTQAKGAKTDNRVAARPAAPGRTASTARQQQATRQQQASRQPNGRAAADTSQARTQRSGLVMRGASAATVSRDSANCTRRNGRTVCGARRDGVAGWQAGLPQVNMAQSECPVGTFATLARGHENVVRCMPL